MVSAFLSAKLFRGGNGNKPFVIAVNGAVIVIINAVVSNKPGLMCVDIFPRLGGFY